jgi:hypothetical protein
MKEMSVDTCYVMHIPDQIPSKLTDTKIVLKPHLLGRSMADWFLSCA